MTKPRANSLDEHIGRKLREVRILAGMSQQELGAYLKLSFQQVQKYERGVNRISAGTLYELSRIFSVPMKEFIEGYHGDENSSACLPMHGEVRELVRDYAHITSTPLKQHLCGMVRACAALSHEYQRTSGANTTHTP